MSMEEREDDGGAAAQARHRSRRVAALVTAGTLALFEIAVLRAAASRGPVPDPEPPPAMALPARKATPKAAAAGLRRQPFLPPLSAEAAADPGHGPLFTPDLAQVTPLAPPPAAAGKPPFTPPVLAADEHFAPEPPPAVPEPLEIDLPTPVPVRLELEGSCPRVTLGPFRLALRCRR